MLHPEDHILIGKGEGLGIFIDQLPSSYKELRWDKCVK